MVLAQTARVLPLATLRVFEGGIDFLIPLAHLSSIAPRTIAPYTLGAATPFRVRSHVFRTAAAPPPHFRTTRDMCRSDARACAPNTHPHPPPPRKRIIYWYDVHVHVISPSVSLLSRAHCLCIFFSTFFLFYRVVCAATVAAPDGSARFLPMSDCRPRSLASSRSYVVRLPTTIRHRRRHHHRTKG